MQVTVQAAPLPSNFRGTPQELIEAFLDRLEITVDGTSFVIADTMPAGNQGPWLKNGSQWWVWSEDESTYVPLDISESFNEQISVGEDEPDPDEFTVWLKTDGSTVLGLFVYMGTEAGWVEKAAELQPNSITSAMIQAEAIRREHIKDLEVTSAKIQNDLPLAKLFRGSGNYFLRMTESGGTATWATLSVTSTELDFTNAATQEVVWTHNLSVAPSFVRAYLVCKEAEGGYAVDDEVDIGFGSGHDASFSRIPGLMQNDEEVKLLCGEAIKIKSGVTPYTAFLPTPAKWKIKFRATVT
jgi:hypothetical protein